MYPFRSLIPIRDISEQSNWQEEYFVKATEIQSTNVYIVTSHSFHNLQTQKRGCLLVSPDLCSM